jgi:hypothetical protein
MATSQASLLPNGRQQIFDANGNPLVGGSVYFYEVGTEIPMTTWANPGMTIANPNPIVLDDLGSMSAYGVGSYRQMVYNAAGALQWDEVVDSGTNSNGSSGGGGGGGVSGIGTNGSTGTSSVGIYVTNVVAGEAIAAGAPVNLFTSGGTPACRNANAASTSQREAHAFNATAVAPGQQATVYINGVVSGLAGLTPGQDYYLGTGSGAISSTGASQSGQLYQKLGVGLNNTSLIMDLSPAVLLA